MAKETYTKTLENLKIDKTTGSAIDKRTGKFLTSLEVDLVKHYAKREDPHGKIAKGKARKKSAITKAKAKSTGKTPGQRASAAIKKKAMPGRKKR